MGRSGEHWLCSACLPASTSHQIFLRLLLKQSRDHKNSFYVMEGERKQQIASWNFLIWLARLTSTGGWLKAKDQGSFQWSWKKIVQGLSKPGNSLPCPKIKKSHLTSVSDWQKASGNFFSPHCCEGTCARPYVGKPCIKQPCWCRASAPGEERGISNLLSGPVSWGMAPALWHHGNKLIYF